MAFAALTNTCAMGMLLAKLPYNRGAACDAQTVVAQLVGAKAIGRPVTAMLALTVALAVLVGVSLGLLGGGGSILTVPLLAYVAAMDAKQAIATSLLVVGVTSAIGAISHARAGRVRWRTGVIFGLAGMAGAYSGGRLARFIPGTVLLIAFAVMMVATGRRDAARTQGHRRRQVARIALPLAGRRSTASWWAWSPGSSAPVAVSSSYPHWRCWADCLCPSRSAPRWWSSR